jgi:hypothetical protein
VFLPHFVLTITIFCTKVTHPNEIYRFGYRSAFISRINGLNVIKGKGKAVPLQAWSGPEVSTKLRFPDFMTTRDCGKVVSLTHRPPLPPGNTPGTHFY